MSPDIKHKHAGHIISIEGRLFTANDAGMWDLTNIWQTLKSIREDVAKRQPGRWNQTAEGQRFSQDGKTVLSGTGRGRQTLANKQAMLRYAAYVSPEFEDMVFSAFEAVLEMPEVALLVADKMRSLGDTRGAEALDRQIFNDRPDYRAIRRAMKGLPW